MLHKKLSRLFAKTFSKECLTKEIKLSASVLLSVNIKSIKSTSLKDLPSLRVLWLLPTDSLINLAWSVLRNRTNLNFHRFLESVSKELNSVQTYLSLSQTLLSRSHTKLRKVYLILSRVLFLWQCLTVMVETIQLTNWTGLCSQVPELINIIKIPMPLSGIKSGKQSQASSEISVLATIWGTALVMKFNLLSTDRRKVFIRQNSSSQSFLIWSGSALNLKLNR